MTHHAIIMAAPNGARKTKQDHPTLPVDIDETVTEAKRCFEAGATVLHAHVRGSEGEHVLDSGLYLELLREMHKQVPEMLVQMTTEAVGRYTPIEQAECVFAVKPRMISMAVKEIAAENCDLELARRFYYWNLEHKVHTQHIVFDAEDLERLSDLQLQGVVPPGRLCVLFVLGKYARGQESVPADIDPFLKLKSDWEMDWFVCAFGSQEHACAMGALRRGGHARVGFENNTLLQDGSQADRSADLVDSLRAAAESEGINIAGAKETRTILGIDR